jgi:hypothetical protein
MNAAGVRAALLLGSVYLVVGLLFGELAGRAASVQGRVAWRWAAWIVSGVAFGAHILYEQVRLRSSPRITAFRVSSAAALGAFGLAVAANVHAYATSALDHSLALGLSLLLWPVITMLPAFCVAFVAAILVARVRR